VVAVSLLLVLMSRSMYTRAAVNQPSFDWPGSALLASGLTLAIVALRMPGIGAWWLGASGAALLIVFPFWERRAASPVVDFSLLGRAAFFGGGSIIALQNMAMYPLLFQLPIFFDQVRHLDPRDGPGATGADGGHDARSVAGGRRRAIGDARRHSPVRS
jgi:hypothetical protein